MTAQKHLKDLVRSRMKKTGERYAAARRHVVHHANAQSDDPLLRWHFPGSVPAVNCLRSLLAHAGVKDPHTGAPFAEAMLLGIAGGIGIGMFQFFYEKENFASFFIAGRHLWQDEATFLRQACDRLGVRAEVAESAGAKAADKQLRAALEKGPCIAWVDMSLLPHRAMPAMYQGGGYHVITVYRIDGNQALIGDLTDQPISVGLSDLAASRARIKKDKHRILSVTAGSASKNLADLVHEGLKACHGGLTGSSGWKNVRTNFQLEALRVWAERMHGSKDKESWEHVFVPGNRLWRGLVSIYDFIEHYGTGGGLCRPIFAEFLAEAGTALKDARFTKVSERYAMLGRQWSELADAALPDDVPILRQAKEVCVARSEAMAASAPPDEIRAHWDRLSQLESQARTKFILSDAACAELRGKLKSRIMALYEGETAALAEVVKLATK